MEQLECSNCGLPLAEDESFCGSCGTRARRAYDQSTVRQGMGAWPDARGGAQARRSEVGPALSDRFFQHASCRSGNPLTNATRYLCAASYLNPAFATTVIWELLASRRAVAPSIGIDLGPVIRNCLNSRRIQLIRDVILTILLVVGVFLVPLPTFAVLIAGAILAFLPGGMERRSLGVKLLAWRGHRNSCGGYRYRHRLHLGDQPGRPQCRTGGSARGGVRHDGRRRDSNLRPPGGRDRVHLHPHQVPDPR